MELWPVWAVGNEAIAGELGRPPVGTKAAIAGFGHMSFQEMSMQAQPDLNVQYDVETMRVMVSYGDRRVSLPGKYDDLAEARKAADAYAKKYLIKK